MSSSQLSGTAEKKRVAKKKKGASAGSAPTTSATKKRKTLSAKEGQEQSSKRRKRKQNLRRIPLAAAVDGGEGAGDDDDDDDDCDSDGSCIGQGGGDGFVEGASAEAVYAAILVEVRDLLSAASEAQSLGRLKMASSYLLLVHARLIGLGKRVDRAMALGSVRDHECSSQENDNSTSAASIDAHATSTSAGALSGRDSGASETTVSVLGFADSANQPGVVTATTDKSMVTLEKKYSTPPRHIASIQKRDVDLEIDTSTAMNQSRRPPTSVLVALERMDRSLVESLARAAMELHNRRTGRGPQHEHNRPPKTNNGNGDQQTDIQRKEARENGDVVASSHDEPMGSKKHKTIRHDDEDDGVNDEEGEEDPKEPVTGDDGEAAEANSHKKRKGGRAQRPPAAAVPTVPDACYDARALLQGLTPILPLAGENDDAVQPLT